MGREIKIVKKLPENPKKGERYKLKTKKGRLITFEATGKIGFQKWKIIKNEPA